MRILLVLVVFILLAASCSAKRASTKKVQARRAPPAFEDDDEEEEIRATAPPPRKRREPVPEAKGPETSEARELNNSPPLSKLEELSGLLQPVTWLTDKNFTKWVGDRPRDYHAVLMFTATAPTYQCAICVMSKTVFLAGAELYQEQYNFLAGGMGQSEDMGTAAKRVAFFILEADNARSIFSNMGLETVPRIFALPPTKASSPKMRMQDFEIPVQQLLEGGPAGFIKELSGITGVDVRATSNPWPPLLLLGLAAYFLALLAAGAARNPQSAIYWYRKPGLWAGVSTLCFCVGVSGSIFCIIRSPPLYGTPKGGKGIAIFGTQGQQQYLIEGLVVAALTVGCGLSLVMINQSSKLKVWGPLRHMLVILSLTAFTVCAMEIAECYIYKTPWYNLKETVPKDLWGWFSSGLRKNSSLGKRLWRISEIWMYEFKDWSAFGNKVGVILGDWAQRAVGLQQSL